jgi:REP element-mobilizing transposase RayT
MGQSLVKNVIHIVFSTKYRIPSLIPSVAPDVHAYISGICWNLECRPIIVGGYLDHVHVLCELSKNIALADLLKNVKGDSSAWIKTIDHSFHDFYWQRGYGAFSVSPRNVERVTRYIQRQEIYHKRKSFQNEFRGLLRSNNTEYDERYVWD